MSSINLSKTEFTAYLECPFKYYLIQDLNRNKPYGPRGKRDYSKFASELQYGMSWHKWLMYFHSNYEDNIISDIYPFEGDKSLEAKLMKQFYEWEKETYAMNHEFWHPIVVEQYLENKHYRGIIDRIDLLNSNGDIRIIEYKSRPGNFDQKELMFYAVLLSQNKETIEDLPTNSCVKEIGVYYYMLGEWRIEQITKEQITNYDNYLYEIKKEILKPNWKKSKTCDLSQTKCTFKEVCPFIPL